MGNIQPATIARWFEDYARTLVLYARQWVAGGEAEDVVQDVFTSLIRQRTQPDDVKAWLYRAARNAALDRLRSGKRRRGRETQTAKAQPACFESRPEDLIDARIVCEQLEKLPEAAREIIVLRIWAGLTFAQIGAVTGVAPATALRHYRQALQQIRQRLEQSCKTNPTR